MAPTSLKPALVSVIHDLVSLYSTHQDAAAALDRLEHLVAPLALDPSSNLAQLDRFLETQDSHHLNLTAVLLEHLARSLALDRAHAHAHAQARPALVWTNWTRALRLVQGLLLLHRPSQRLFARKASFEYLLAILDLTPQAATHLALAALDVLLCALVDRPANVRVFEDLDGLAALVGTLKDKAVAQPVRIKVIELLYFYLLPEAAPPVSSAPDPALASSTSSTTSVPSSTLDERVLSLANPSGPAADAADALPRLFASAADGFVPQTPTRLRTRPPPAPSGVETPRAGLERTPSRPGAAPAPCPRPSPSPSPSRTSAPTT
ncbi:hypothetical protein JCM9279_000922, partial [Rhodotorula babjevae]